jgi:hypothetical protein
MSLEALFKCNESVTNGQIPRFHLQKVARAIRLIETERTREEPGAEGGQRGVMVSWAWTFGLGRRKSSHAGGVFIVMWKYLMPAYCTCKDGLNGIVYILPQ